MVYVNSQKFACASCIKGHRSSSCHHTNRPLFEIKKKGRPISQCETCRELRKNKHMHIKCNCAGVAPPGSSTGQIRDLFTAPSTPRRQARRQPPANPTLPNGLKDLWPKEPLLPQADVNPKQTVDALLNPCNCRSVWKCKCLNRGERPSVQLVTDIDQDNATAQSPVSSAVSSCCIGNNDVPSSPGGIAHSTTIPTPSAADRREQRQMASMLFSRPSLLSSSPLTLPTSSVRDVFEDQDDPATGLHLPPLELTRASFPDSSPPSLPPLKNVYTSTGGANADAMRSLTRCGCGSTCACPGCKEHRGPGFAALSREDCPDGCGSCVDHMGGPALPSSFSVTQSSLSVEPSSREQSHPHIHVKYPSAFMSTVDHFYAIAALIPPPPSSFRAGPGMLDPTNVAVYQPSPGQKHDWQRAAGLVQIPPLNCCAGRCKCPGGMCGCGTECGGACGRHGIDTGLVDAKGKERVVEGVSKENEGTRTVRGCCAGKKTALARGNSTSPKNVLRL